MNVRHFRFTIRSYGRRTIDPIPYKLFVPCNWLQVHENAADPIHTAYLHAIVSGIQFSPAFGALPVLDFFEYAAWACFRLPRDVVAKISGSEQAT